MNYFYFNKIRIIMNYTIYMYIYEEYNKFKEHFKDVNDFVYKNRIHTIIKYYNENIATNLEEHVNKINYKYYKNFELNAIEIIENITNKQYVPYFRILSYNDNNNIYSYGIHRYGWKNVISNFLKQTYYENTDFYYENPEFEWVSYAKSNDLYDYKSAKEHYLANIKNKSEMKYNKMKFIIFDEWFEKKYTWGAQKDIFYKYNFISFNHDPPIHEIPEYLYKIHHFEEFKKIFENNEKYRKEKDNLKILFTLSKHQKKYIEHTINLPKNTLVKSLCHPLEIKETKNMFDIKKYIENENKKLYCIGWWLRKYDIFLKLSCNKVILMKSKEGIHVNNYIANEIRKNIINNNTNIKSFESKNNTDLMEIINLNYTGNDFTQEERKMLNLKYNIEIKDFLENNEYDKIFNNNIVFLDLYNCVANNIILECIMNNTPILICMNKSIVEYLGKDYPFYFTNYIDAEMKLKDLDLITKTHYYLKNMDKTKFTYQYFNNELNSIIMKNI